MLWGVPCERHSWSARRGWRVVARSRQWPLRCRASRPNLQLRPKPLPSTSPPMPLLPASPCFPALAVDGRA
eukprot:6486950-Prorocentrum_lima.AAC.1